MQNLYQFLTHSLINSWNWIHVMSDNTLHMNMTPLKVEDRLPMKTLQTENGWTVEKMTVEFPARQWKWHMLFDLLPIIESTGFTKRLSGSDRCCSELTDSNIKSINNLNCSQDGQLGHYFTVEMFSVNFITFGFCKLSFCYDSSEIVAGIDTFSVVPLPAAKQRIFNHNIQNLPILRVTS